MRKTIKLALSLLPVLLTLGGWKVAIFINQALGWASVGKDPLPCIVGGVNVQLGLSFFAWYGMLLWVPGLCISGLLIGDVIAGNFPRPWGTRPEA